MDKKVKDLIEKYCMGMMPTDSQIDEINKMVAETGTDWKEAIAYQKEMINGPTREEREKAEREAQAKKEAERKAKAAKAKAEKEAKAKAERAAKAKEEAERKAREEADREAKKLDKTKTQEKESSSVKFITVGKLIRGLRKFKREYADCYVSCCLPDGRMCCITGMQRDKDDILCLNIEEDDFDGSYYDVDGLLFELDGYDKTTKVYLAGCGLYLTFACADDGSLFDEGEEDCVEFSYEVVGEYKEVKEDDDYVNDQTDTVVKKHKKEGQGYTIALIAIAVLLAYGLYYNVSSIINHSGSSTLMSIIWSVVCFILLVISVLSLYHSKDG